MLNGIAATTRIVTRRLFTVQKRRLTFMGYGPWIFLIIFYVCIRDCILSFSFVFFSLKLVIENKLVKNIFKYSVPIPLKNYISLDLWVDSRLDHHFVEYSWICFTFSKFRNKTISTKRLFVSLVGARGSGKLRLIHDWLIFGTFQPEFDILFDKNGVHKPYYFYQHYQSLYGLMSKNIKNIKFNQSADFDLI